MRLSPDDPCLVIGTGTKFTKELAPKKKIALPKAVGSISAEVVEVISDTEVKVKREFSGDSGKGTKAIRQKTEGEGNKGLTFKVLPHLDQEEMYRHVYRTLKEGGCIGIFPEGDSALINMPGVGLILSSFAGGSHDRTDLLPLKAGVSLMALGAMANTPGLKVKIVPVGLSYFHAHKFRSRAVVEFGSAIDVPDELVELFKKGGDAKRQASTKLLDIIYDGLKTVTIRTPDYDTLMVGGSSNRYALRHLHVFLLSV